jgi:hypothetical protein
MNRNYDRERGAKLHSVRLKHVNDVKHGQINMSRKVSYCNTNIARCIIQLDIDHISQTLIKTSR